MATEIIEHVFDTDGFLLEIKRILKPGGYLIISTPNLVSLRSRLGTLMGRLPAHVEYRTTEGNAGHIRGYNIGAFKSQLEEHDFEIIELTTSGIAIPLVHIFIKKIPDFLISFGEAIIVEAKNIKY
jgi:SAM-dependent methyltransferase